MSFFKQFPKTTYSIQNDAIQTEITDYFRYVDVNDRLAKNVEAYQKVDILNGERPDNLSQRLYGTPDYYWTFFIVNDFLKEGLSAWPKSQAELENHITTSHKNLSAYRFPLYLGGALGTDKITPLGLPINQDKYLPYLYLGYYVETVPRSGSGAGVTPAYDVYAIAKIRSYEPNLSLIFIDKSTITVTTTHEPVNAAITAIGSQKNWPQKAQDKFNLTSGVLDQNFVVLFVSDGTDAANISKRNYLNTVNQLANELRPDGDPALLSNVNTIDREYKIAHTQNWKDAKLAPAHYYTVGNKDDAISEYDAGIFSTNYVSRQAEITEENEEHRSIKYVAPAYIQSFVREYKKLLNE